MLNETDRAAADLFAELGDRTFVVRRAAVEVGNDVTNRVDDLGAAAAIADRERRCGNRAVGIDRRTAADRRRDAIRDAMQLRPVDGFRC
ncbi:hypothetical protein LXE92_20000 [Burkholderia contaminans]|nr:hypothetical protein [Burkholderia contaminans]WFN13245.1 hypothetical protein LXE92_20000 [Burkholderia contaminans]